MSRCLMMCAYFQTHEKGGGGGNVGNHCWGSGKFEGSTPLSTRYVLFFGFQSRSVGMGVKKLKKSTISQCCFHVVRAASVIVLVTTHFGGKIGD